MGESPKTLKVEKIICAKCLQPTNHTILCTYETRWDDDAFCGGSTHDFMKCNGCETATYRHKSWFSEDPEPSYTFYPERPSAQADRTPKSFDHLAWGSPVESAYRQTLAAFNQQLLLLAGAGVRFVIEGVCKERKIRDGNVTDKNGVTRRKNNLEGKINGLVEKDFIGAKQAAVLHQIRFLGNDAAHDLYQPTPEEVNLAIDIVEHLLEQVYEQPAKAKALAVRKRKKK